MPFNYLFLAGWLLSALDVWYTSFSTIFPDEQHKIFLSWDILKIFIAPAEERFFYKKFAYSAYSSKYSNNFAQTKKKENTLILEIWGPL
jgi:hypothetical protein